MEEGRENYGNEVESGHTKGARMSERKRRIERGRTMGDDGA